MMMITYEPKNVSKQIYTYIIILSNNDDDAEHTLVNK